MFFLLQKNVDKTENNIDILILENMIRKNRIIHDYCYCTLDELQETDLNNFVYKNSIPVGTIEFVTVWLKRYKGIDKINPIEVPKCLRTDEFLKRDYRIIKSHEIPQSGKYFLKDISELKLFSYIGDLKALRENHSANINDEHLYQLSEIVDIKSEYRVYIFNGEIENICHYNGDPCILPDMSLIQKANIMYSLDKAYPNSYTLDIMITNRGTSIIEVHPFISVGLYSSIFSNGLLYAYRDGIDYVFKHNNLI